MELPSISTMLFILSLSSFNFFMRNDHSFLLTSWNMELLILSCSTHSLLFCCCVFNTNDDDEQKFHFLWYFPLVHYLWLVEPAWTWAVGGFVKYFFRGLAELRMMTKKKQKSQKKNAQSELKYLQENSKYSPAKQQNDSKSWERSEKIICGECVEYNYNYRQQKIYII